LDLVKIDEAKNLREKKKAEIIESQFKRMEE
jgi:hypothetical protein